MSIFLPIEEWGNITTPKELDLALEAFVNARRTLTDPRHVEAANAAGLTVPPVANADWIVLPISPQGSYRIIDLRAGTTFLNVPLVQGRPTKSGGYPFAATSVIGTVVEHQPAPGPGAPAAGVVLQRVVHGGSSTSCQLVRPVTKELRRWYPKAMEGISPGQPLVVTLGEDTWSVIVADVGWDSDPDQDPTRPSHPLPYFTVADRPPPGNLPLPPLPFPATTRIQRKTAIGGLAVIEEDHTLNQQSALEVAKYAYSDGDALCGGFSLNYQGDFVSAGGDEGGLGATVELIQDLQLFSGIVENFTQEKIGTDQRQAWVLTHQIQSHLNVERLAAGRPIINLNENKWTQGTCRVWNSNTYPNATALNVPLGVVEVPGSTLPPEVVGRFISINEPSEYIDPHDSFSASSGLQPVGIGIVRRWFQITDLQSDPARGSQLLQVRFKLVDAYQGGIQLVDTSHFSFTLPKGEGGKDVKFIIAPGGLPYDVSRAVAQDDNGNPPTTRKILMQPNADTDLKLRDPKHDYPFAKGDLVGQALGSRSVNPTGFRVRHHTSWPTQSENYPDASFYAQNGGAAQVGIGLMIQGAGRTRLADDESRFRGTGGAAYDTGVWIHATTRTAIRVQGEVAPPHGVNLPPGQPVAGVALHMDQTGGPAARKVIGWTNDPQPETQTTFDLTTIGYDPASGSFQIVGAETVKIVGAKTFDLGGAKISNAAPSAGLPTLRGTVSVPPAQPAAQGSTQPRAVAATARVTFASLISGDYIAMVAPGWMTGFGVTKREDGFTVTFDTAPPAAPPGQSGQETFDWIVYR